MVQEFNEDQKEAIREWTLHKNREIKEAVEKKHIIPIIWADVAVLEIEKILNSPSPTKKEKKCCNSCRNQSLLHAKLTKGFNYCPYCGRKL